MAVAHTDNDVIRLGFPSGSGRSRPKHERRARIQLVYIVVLVAVLAWTSNIPIRWKTGTGSVSVDAAAAGRDFYAVLGLPRQATDSEIKKAFRKLSLQFHPDKNPGDDQAAQKYLELQEANEVLSNPDKRAIYDIHGEEGLKKGAQQQQNPFASFFGGGLGQQRGNNFQVEMSVTLDSVFNGERHSISVNRNVVCPQCRGTGAKAGKTRQCKKCGGSGNVARMQQIAPGFVIQTQQPCDKCGGTGSVFKHKCPHCAGNKVVNEAKELVIELERGIPDGHTVVFERAGEQTPGVIPGDVIVKLVIKDHPIFRREGDDLYMKKSISLRSALLGTEFSFLHLDGRTVEVKHESIIPNGYVLKLEDEGMPVHNFPSDKGDLYIQFRVEFPKDISKDGAFAIRQAFNSSLPTIEQN